MFFNAPSWRDPDFFACLLLQRILGNFNSDMYFEQMQDLEGQSNQMHELVKSIPDLQRYDAIYSPYSDCGIFGHYFFGDPRFSNQMSFVGGIIGEVMSEYLSEVEVTRAKYKLYSELLSVQSASDIMQQYGPQFVNLHRKVTRTEIA